jgi:SNF2 family DNA or RNA helicase
MGADTPDREGEIIDFRTRQRQTVETVGRQQEYVKNQLKKLGDYYQRLDADAALATHEEDPEGVFCPSDLSKMDLSKNRSFGSRSFEKVLFDGLAADWQPVAGDVKKMRALNNLVQLEHFGYLVQEPAGIMKVPDDYQYSPQVNELEGQVQQKKIALLRETLGQENVASLDELRNFFKEGLASQQWQDEEADGVKQIRSNSRSAGETLDFMEALAGMDLSGVPAEQRVQRLSDAQDKKRLQAVRKQIETGDFSSIANQSDHTVRFLAEEERRWRDERAQKRTAVKIDLMRAKVKEWVSAANSAK